MFWYCIIRLSILALLQTKNEKRVEYGVAGMTQSHLMSMHWSMLEQLLLASTEYHRQMLLEKWKCIFVKWACSLRWLVTSIHRSYATFSNDNSYGLSCGKRTKGIVIVKIGKANKFGLLCLKILESISATAILHFVV